MADGNLDQSAGGENSAQQSFGEQWYQERWRESAAGPIAFDQLAKAESLIDAAGGLARILTADMNALDFNAECQGCNLPTMSSQDRGSLGIALLQLLEDAAMQMAKSRRD